MGIELNIVLLSEDDENDIIITKRKLVKSSLKINELLIAKSLDETRKLVNERNIDLIFQDLNLPDSTGLDTVKAVREFYPGILIVLTSMDDEVVGVEAIRLGADEYLVKNEVSETTLIRAVLHSIERRKMKDIASKAKDNISKLQAMMGKEE